MLGRVVPWLGTLANLGRMWLKSREPHIEETLPGALGEGAWVAIATSQPLQPGQPVYGTPAYRAVEAGQRFWIFLPEGEYWVYAVPGTETQAALKQFYAAPDDAVLIGGGHQSAPGFRAELSS